MNIYEKYIKRLFDITLALVSIIITSPVLIVLSIMVKVKLGSPIIFSQYRPGKNERIFKMYKFRSMTDERDEVGQLLPDDIRLTEFGKKLRATSLDELPELFNILKGDMSFVGPRPQLVRDMVFMSKEERKRHIVRPGLTGLAQISGRNAISWEKKFEFDLKYINRISFFNDIRIFMKTFSRVKKSEGVSMEGMETAEDYGDYLYRIGKIDRKTYEEKINEAKKIIGAK